MPGRFLSPSFYSPSSHISSSSSTSASTSSFLSKTGISTSTASTPLLNTRRWSSVAPDSNLGLSSSFRAKGSSIASTSTRHFRQSRSSTAISASTSGRKIRNKIDITASSLRSISTFSNRGQRGCRELGRTAPELHTLSSRTSFQQRQRGIASSSTLNNSSIGATQSSTAEKQSRDEDKMGSTDTIHQLLHANSIFASSLSQSHPDLLPALAKGQSPKILWLGCSDSRCPETTLLNALPGDIFVHRNIANIIHPSDLSVNSVLEFSVGVLKVEHIILCGHTTCGGVAAALANNKVTNGCLETWLMPLRTLRRENLSLLKSLDPTAAGLKLVELNVEQGVKTLRENATVVDAIRDRGLKVHGMVYDVGTGKLRDLEISGEEERERGEREEAFALS